MNAQKSRTEANGIYWFAAERQIGNFRLRTLFRRTDYLSEESEMRLQVVVVLYAVAMAAIIVGVDVAFFRNRFWERLMVNIGIVLVFAAFYMRFLKRP